MAAISRQHRPEGLEPGGRRAYPAAELGGKLGGEESGGGVGRREDGARVRGIRENPQDALGNGALLPLQPVTDRHAIGRAAERKIIELDSGELLDRRQGILSSPS